MRDGSSTDLHWSLTDSGWISKMYGSSLGILGGPTKYNTDVDYLVFLTDIRS